MDKAREQIFPISNLFDLKIHLPAFNTYTNFLPRLQDKFAQFNLYYSSANY